MRKFILALIPLFLLTACQDPFSRLKTPDPVPKLGTSAPLPDTKAETDKLIAAHNATGAAAAAGFQVIKDANSQTTETPTKQFIDLETSAQMKALPAPDPEKLREANERKLAVLAGEKEKIATLYEKAIAENLDAKAKIDSLNSKVQDLFTQLFALEEKRKQEIAESEKRIAALMKEVDEAKKRADESLQRWTGRIFVIAGISGFGLIAVFLFFAASAPGGIMLGIKKTWVLGVLSAMSIGLGQLVSQWWFKFAAGGAALLGCVGVAVYFYVEWRAGKEAKAKEKALEVANATLQKIVPVIDEVGKETKEVLLPALSKRMDSLEKAYVHRIREKLQGAQLPS